MMKKNLLLILMCFVCGLVYAHDGLNFRNLDVKSGISDNYVRSVLRDQYGFMWFATLNGLNRYDGYQFKKYTTTQLGAYNNDIESIAEDAAGNIWIKGPVSYYIYDREQDKLENKIQPVLNKYGITGEVSYLTVDKDYNLWCTVMDTLFHYDFAKSKLHTFQLPGKEKMQQVVCRRSCAYLLFSNGEIARIDSNFQHIRPETRRTISSGLQYNLYIDTVDRLWFYASHASGLQCYDTNQKQWIDYVGRQEVTDALITAVMDDGDGNLWIGTDDKGVYISYNQDKQLVRINKKSENPFSLADNHINCFFKDNQNTMWVGTGKQGVSFAALDKIAFNTCFLPEQEDVKCLQEDKEGNLWMGFDGEGLIRQDAGKASYTRFKMKKHSIPSDLIICSCLDAKGRLWFGTYGGGAFYEQGGTFIPLRNAAPASLKYIRRIAEDANGTIWFGTFMQGLYAMDADGNFTAYTMDSSILQTNSIMDLAYSGGRNLYVGTSSGLYSMDIYTRKMVPLTGNKAGTQSLPDSYITCLFYDSRGLLWIGTRTGMTVFDEKKDGMIHLSIEDGLSHQCIRAVTEDKYKNIWVATDHGITNIWVAASPTGKSSSYLCYPYFEEDGIGDMTFNSHSITCTGQGEILMGGIGGYLKITPRPTDFYNRSGNPVVFTDLLLANQKMEVGSRTSNGRILLPKNIQLLEEITMDYSDSNFALEVSSMDYQNRHKQQFAYRLGEQEEWVKLEGNRIHRNAVALLDEVNQLLDFRKLDKQKAQLSLSYGNLSDFVKETCDSFKELSLKNGIQLELNLMDADISMSFDRNKMQRILLNLLSNAVKYNREDGSVVVTVDKIRVSEKEHVRIQVADTGIGIKDENKEKVFDRFFQEQHAATTYVGSGIGLHIVKEYVTLHQGTIRITDNRPQGSIFVITLPVVGGTNEERQLCHGSQEEGISVLVVEDNDDFRRFLVGCLKEHYQVFEASNGKEALEILSQQSVQMVISDVMMPVMDGLELCHAVKTDIRFSHIPVILLTARTAEEHVLGGLREGADDYITKPFNLDILLLRIQKLLQWTQSNHEKFGKMEVSPSEITISSLDEQLIEKAIRIVEENMDNSEFSVEELSAQIGISRSGLYKKLMSITGKSPLEFMRILRLKRGKQLLEKSQLSISQIAYQVGLSPKQFAKYFKEEYGCLPSEYN